MARRKKSAQVAAATQTAGAAEQTPSRACTSEYCREWRTTFANIAHMCSEQAKAFPPGQRLAAYLECISKNAKEASQALRAKYGRPEPKPKHRKKSPVPLQEHIKMLAEAARSCKGNPRPQYYECLRNKYRELREKYLAEHGITTTAPAATTPAPPVAAPPPVPAPPAPAGEQIPAVAVELVQPTEEKVPVTA